VIGKTDAFEEFRPIDIGNQPHGIDDVAHGYVVRTL